MSKARPGYITPERKQRLLKGLILLEKPGNVIIMKNEGTFFLSLEPKTLILKKISTIEDTKRIAAKHGVSSAYHIFGKTIYLPKDGNVNKFVKKLFNEFEDKQGFKIFIKK